MAWIPSHQELARHPKTRKLARQLKMGVPCAIGTLHLLWWWALDYAEDGVLTRYTPDDLADAVLWEGDPLQLRDALFDAGWIDATEAGYVLHDWDFYTGRLVEGRRKDAERKRLARRQTPELPPPSAGRPPDIQRSSGVTVQNNTEPEIPPSVVVREDAPAEVKPIEAAPIRKRKPRDRVPVDDDFKLAIVAEFSPQLGAERTQLGIDRCLVSTSFRKSPEPQKYLRNWLRKDCLDHQERQAARRPMPPPKETRLAPPAAPSPFANVVDTLTPRRGLHALTG